MEGMLRRSVLTGSGRFQWRECHDGPEGCRFDAFAGHVHALPLAEAHHQAIECLCSQTDTKHRFQGPRKSGLKREMEEKK